MPFKLIFSEFTNESEKDIGENVFLDNLPDGYKVYIFYYPGAMRNEDMESGLRNLGEITGKNLFVNIGKLNDPNYNKIADNFKIKKLPAIVMTAVNELASADSLFVSAYVKIDNPEVLKAPEKLMDTLQKLFNLFVSGQIAEALKEAKKDDRKTMLAKVIKVVGNALKEIWKFIDERDISVSLAEGKFELKHR